MKSEKDQKQTDAFRREVPKMPEGYYSGDQPNPNLRAFVEEHIRENPYDPVTDNYEVPAFNKSIETTKATAIYNMHTYWSKKPHDAIREYIRHYTKSGDLVADPFCGSGSTGLAALMEGRKAILIDRSPAATFIAKNYCTPVDVNELQKAFEDLQLKVKPELDWLYETRCDRCGGKATTVYTVYSQVFQCPRCLEKVALFDCPEVESRTAAGKPKKIHVCPNCFSRGIQEQIKTNGEKFGSIPVLVSYLCQNSCKPARGERRHNDPNPKKREYFERYDLGKIREIEGKEIPHWYPKDRMMNAPEEQECWGVKWRAGTSNFRTVDELFTKRNLWALAAIRDASINTKFSHSFLFCLTGIALSMSRMYLWGPGDEHGTIKGTYYVPQLSRSQNAYEAFCSKVNDFRNAQNVINEIVEIIFLSTQSTTNLDSLPTNSLDYIFTDPPYADKVQYGELNFVWEAWLGLDTHWHEDEIIVNEVRGKTEEDWANMMRQAMGECFRVLKPGRCISLCYHDTSEGTWALVQDIMAEAGFIVEKSDTALYIDTGQKSYNQLTADKVTKRDLVINFRKPKLGEIAPTFLLDGTEDDKTFTQKVHTLIALFLADHPGTTKDRIYDEVISHMVRAGTMEAHDFEGLLSQIAEPIYEPVKKNLFENEDPDLFGKHQVARWYLKETAMALQDDAESTKEETSAAKLNAFIREWQKKNEGQEGVHYSDLFEHFVYAIPPADKPRRQLAEWLSDFFYKTPEGAWRLPATPQEEAVKKEGRERGLSRRIRRYLSFLEQGIPVPTNEQPSVTTLMEWIRHAARAGLYEQGKALYEQGGLNLDALSEEQQVAVEEDYSTCLRMMKRVEAPVTRRGRKPKQPQLFEGEEPEE